jgi:hypothetical protein
MRADPMSDAELEARLRQLSVAVAEQTTAEPRGLQPAPSNRRTDARAARWVPVAAALVFVLGITVAVVAGRSSSDDVRTGDPVTGDEGIPLVPEGLPTVAPTWLPDSMVLDSVQVQPGGTTGVGWARRYRAPSSTGDGSDTLLVVRARPPSAVAQHADVVTNPDVAQQIDVDGATAWVNTTIDSWGSSSVPERRGFVVVWTMPSGVQVSVDTHGISWEQAVAVAQGVRVEGSPEEPTIAVDPAAVPAGYVESSAGPEVLGFGWSDSGVGFIRTGYVGTEPIAAAPDAEPDMTERFASFSITQSWAPAIGVDAWVQSFGPGAEVTTAGGLTVVVAATGTDQMPRAGAFGEGALVQVSGNEIRREDVRAVAQSLRVLGPRDWVDLLASARSLPHPERVESAEAAPICAALRGLSEGHELELRQEMEEAQADPSTPPSTTVADGSDLLGLVEDAPEPLAASLRVLGEYQRDAGAARLEQLATGVPGEWRVEHEDVVALRAAIGAADDWIVRSCTDPVSIRQVVSGMPPLPLLTPQDPALDAFCQRWQDLARRRDAEGHPLASSAAYAAELEGIIGLVPGERAALRTTLDQVRAVWAATPDGEQYPVGVDPTWGNHAPVNWSCPDWPT